MRFGIYSEIQTPPAKSHYEMIWEIMRQIEHADQSGFDVYSVIDHHFFEKFSISANPLAMFAAAAQRTERIRFRENHPAIRGPQRASGINMNTNLTSIYRSPGSHETLVLDGASSDGDEIVSGSLIAADGSRFRIEDGVPDFTWPQRLRDPAPP